MGSKPGSVGALLSLVKNGFNIQAVVVTEQDSEWLPTPSLREVATKLGFSVYDSQNQISGIKTDLLISYMYRDLVKEETLELARYPINFHAGPLPNFGGWAFYNVAILEEQKEYGCTCHIMDKNFDTGPIVEVRKFSINPNNETAISLEKKSQKVMLKMFVDIIKRYKKDGDLNVVEQDKSTHRYMNKKQFSKLKIIPEDTNFAQADRIARAFWYPPYELAYFLTKRNIKIEMIPEVAKNDLAHHLHENDLKDLLDSCELTFP